MSNAIAMLFAALVWATIPLFFVRAGQPRYWCLWAIMVVGFSGAFVVSRLLQ